MTLGWDNPTADPTTTILLRHGDTRLSPEHRFTGRRDLPLSASGTRQARAAASRLAAGAPIDAVVSSPLQRAVDTAAIAAGELGLTAVIDDDLRETDFGDWDGFTLEEIQERWPGAAAAGHRPGLPGVRCRRSSLRRAVPVPGRAARLPRPRAIAAGFLPG